LEAKVTLFSPKKTLNLRGKLLDLSSPLVMGILNNTPDSFYDGGRHHDKKSLSDKVARMVDEGADIIDIGGYSSRPGAADVSEEIERTRVLQALEVVCGIDAEIPISVDTFRATVARAAIEAGAHIVNDISGGNQLQVPYILMHMRGTPETMSSQTDYHNLHKEITQYFVNKIKLLHQKGLHDIIIDPGFGFAKTTEQNYDILKNLDYFQMVNCPILVGVSRKSMIYKPLAIKPDEALNGTTALHAWALANGARILRVHDVMEARQTVELYKLVNA